MKIQELLNESELTEVTRPDQRTAEDILEKAGYQKLGHGLYANVWWRKDKSYVLKLVSSNDRAYARYVRMCMSNPNPHFPKFRGSFMRVNDNYNAIRMEKLSPVVRTRDMYDMVSVLESYIWHSAKLLSWPANLERDIQAMYVLEQTQPGITEACDLIATLPKVKIDMHLGNIMMRGKTIVITDPVTGYERTR